MLSASQSPAVPSKPLPGVTLHVHSQPHGRDWHHEARVFRSRWHICFSLPHRGRERPSLCRLDRPFLGKRGECVYLSFTTLGPEKGRSVYFTRAIPSLCISGQLPFERIGYSFTLCPQSPCLLGKIIIYKVPEDLHKNKQESP